MIASIFPKLLGIFFLLFLPALHSTTFTGTIGDFSTLNTVLTAGHTSIDGTITADITFTNEITIDEMSTDVQLVAASFEEELDGNSGRMINIPGGVSLTISGFYLTNCNAMYGGCFYVNQSASLS